MCSIIGLRLSLEGIEKKLAAEEKRRVTKDQETEVKDGRSSGLEPSIKRSKNTKTRDFLKKTDSRV